ncbi:MAG TPA: Gfo/Idh/MocA family oxidoreductase [Bryobacteraceae bacterium]|nr:Gfo/Idh/MocA family oxidoreductase [Bryobacteraceae bacterium]
MDHSAAPRVNIDRRTFFNQTAAAIAGAGVLSSPAFSYSRIKGANDRILLGHIGIGDRGSELEWIVSRLKDKHNVEMAAVCDLWKVNREKAASRAQSLYGRAPRAFQHMEDLLAQKDVDAVLISTADFQHAPVLRAVAEAGKDAYCEKPMANDLDEAKAARDAVLARDLIVQIGTQHRSEPYQIATKQLIDSGALGDVTKVEMVWNYHGPRWRGRPEVDQIREQDTDWRKWLMHKPYRPFDPRAYFEFRLYEDFSSGIADQWLSHGSDLVHYFLNDNFPKSMVAHGGVFAWKDGRQNPDTFQALIEYPKGFLLSFSTSFGNDSDSFSRIMGKKATLINIGGEGSPRWKWVEEKGNHEDDPYIKRAEKYVLLPGTDKIPPPGMGDTDLSHMTNWLECLRSRKAPNATVLNGFAHSVVVTMAARAYREGKKLYWDPKAEQIVDHRV